MMSVRRGRLPADSVIVRPLFILLGNPHKIDDLSARLPSVNRLPKLSRMIPDDEQLGVRQDFVDRLDHHVGNVRNLVIDEFLVRAGQPRQVYALVVQLDILTLSQQLLDEFYYGTLSQIIRVCLEAEPEQPNFPAGFVLDDLHRSIDLLAVARQN